MSARSSWPFVGALLFAGALGVHELRYLIASGEDARAALVASGHAYLAFVEPLVGLALAFALAHVVSRISGGGRRVEMDRHRLAVLLAVGLVAIYTGQELLEGQLAPGHAPGLAGVFGAGGWLAVPLAVVVGGLLSLAVRLADAAADAAVLTAVLRFRSTTDGSATWAPPARWFAPAAAALARHLAGRAPPAPLST